MKRPKSVEILGHTYSIVYLPESEMKNDEGTCELLARTIRIRDNLTDHTMQATVLHEIMHAVLHESGMAYMLNNKLEEALVRALESGIYPLVTLEIFKRGRK